MVSPRDPPADHEDEATCYLQALDRAAPPAETLLELGAGAGNNAFFLKQRFHCTLTDISPEMQALSRELNRDCEHILGDMRSLRLDRTFDTVMIHDAVMYMTTEEDLRAAITTAFVNEAGGAALFAPDCSAKHSATTRLMRPTTVPRAARRRWAWDPDPTDDIFCVDYALLLRDGEDVTSVHDHHVEGLFSRARWIHLLESVGYRVEMVDRPFDDETTDEIFLCRRDPSSGGGLTPIP